jgi:hypothetical protein
MKHTPAPWRFVGKDTYTATILHRPELRITVDHRENLSDPTNDARLIASSPEMYDLIDRFGKAICDSEVGEMIKKGTINDGECEKGETETFIALCVLQHLQAKFMNEIIAIQHKIGGE